MAKESALARLPIGARIGVTVGVLVLAGVAYYIVFFSDISSKIAAAQQRERRVTYGLAGKQPEIAEIRQAAGNGSAERGQPGGFGRASGRGMDWDPTSVSGRPRDESIVVRRLLSRSSLRCS